MIIIGVDPHKRVHTASAVDPATNKQIAALEVEASLAGYRRLLRWAGGFSERRWAVENARGLGQHLAQWLVARGEAVDDVPSTATARVRELSCGGRRKNDVIDAAAAASVAALHGDANPVVAEDLTTVLRLLDERRDNVITQRTRLVNQLHALLRDLVPGGAPSGWPEAWWLSTHRRGHGGGGTKTSERYRAAMTARRRSRTTTRVLGVPATPRRR
jgi:transposase